MKQRRVAVFVVIPVGIAMALFIGVLATREPATDRVVKSPLVGKTAPPIAGKSLLDGEPYDLGRQGGRWTLVNFFATWCTPCKQEHPELRAFQAEHAEKGDAEVVSVVFQDDPETVRRYFEQRGGTWPVVPDERGKVVLDYGVAGIPESFLVDPDGVVRAKIVGGVTAKGLDNVLAQLEGPS